MFEGFVNWLRRMEATLAGASRSDSEVLASELAELRVVAPLYLAKRWAWAARGLAGRF